MRPFYITKGRCGYWRIRLVDMTSGLIVCDRSSRTSDRKAAERLAWQWVRDGVAPVQSGKSSNVNAPLPSVPARSEVSPNLSESEELDLLRLLAKKHGIQLMQDAGSQKTAQSAEASSVSVPASVDAYSPVCKVDAILAKGLPVKLVPGYFDAGILNGIRLCDFITEFWTEEKSPYYEQQRAHRKDINGDHCKGMRSMVGRYWEPFFGDATVDCLSAEILNKFFVYLASYKKLKSSTVNKVYNSLSVALKFYHRHRKISQNPMEQVERFGNDSEKRGILTLEEAQKLFSFEWKDKTKQLANMLAAFTGLRAGEVSCLRYCDIYDDRIYVNHSWNVVDGEKDPKRHEVRWVVCPPKICEALRLEARKNPHFGNDSYVFFAKSKQKDGLVPTRPETWVKALDEALEQIGVSSAARKARNIDFHSWRHFCATEIKERAQIEAARSMLGHSTVAMTEHYAAHETEEHMRVVQKVMDDISKSIVIMPLDLVA